MGLGEAIDITFDFRFDTPPGKDPDSHSPTLRRYHQLLWSKPLPSGAPVELDVTTPGVYLHLRSELVDPRSKLGKFGLSSDAVIPSFSRARELKHIIDQMPIGETEAFNHIGYTIGGMMVFPGYQVDGKMTFNGARGCHPRIRDRFDLTLECIRRHYLDEPSPLGPTLARYADFFGLFGDFAGYVDFFHLQDLVNEDTLTVKFSTPFEDFTASPLPVTLDAYCGYRERAIDFIESRNRRIAAHLRQDALMARTQEGPPGSLLKVPWTADMVLRKLNAGDLPRDEQIALMREAIKAGDLPPQAIKAAAERGYPEILGDG